MTISTKTVFASEPLNCSDNICHVIWVFFSESYNQFFQDEKANNTYKFFKVRKSRWISTIQSSNGSLTEMEDLLIKSQQAIPDRIG